MNAVKIIDPLDSFTLAQLTKTLSIHILILPHSCYKTFHSYKTKTPEVNLIDISTIIVSNILHDMTSSQPGLFRKDALGNIFYSLDMAIRLYRQYAHEQLTANGIDITIDQWLVLKALHENPDLNQHEIALATFKDHASLTRIVELLVKKGMLSRAIHQEDRRRFQLTITKKGLLLLKTVEPIAESNRKAALKGFSKEKIVQLQDMLNQLIKNCNL